MKNKKATNKEKIREALNKAGHSLSINEVSSLTGLRKAQVRNTANYYDSEIVPVGGGEIIYNFLKYTPNKFENIYFLARKSLLRDLYLDEILPDELFRALSKNRYLLILEEKYRKVSYFNLGIKKYFHSHAGEYHRVSILEDEILGKYGYCTECENPMIWDKKRGWRPAGEDEYFDIYLDKSFFKKGRN